MTNDAKQLPRVELYTDGACSGNPGPGGWGYVLRHPGTGKEVEGSGAEPATTNNRMELQAVIEGLRVLKKPARVELWTDSQYVGKGVSEWMKGWKRNNWMRKAGNKMEPVKNVELWQELDGLLARHEVSFHWIRGHNGHPENERCDQMAVEAYRQLSRS